MDRMVAYCGLVCNECPTFIATMSNDKRMKMEIAKQWSQMYNTNINPREIFCKGCKSKQTYKGCNNCEIRKCSTSKNVQTCAHCSDYTCDKLDGFFSVAPQAKENLDRINQQFRPKK